MLVTAPDLVPPKLSRTMKSGSSFLSLDSDGEATRDGLNENDN